MLQDPLGAYEASLQGRQELEGQALGEREIRWRRGAGRLVADAHWALRLLAEGARHHEPHSSTRNQKASSSRLLPVVDPPPVLTTPFAEGIRRPSGAAGTCRSHINSAPMGTATGPANRLLAHLELEREVPSLDYLHRIIRQHQLRVPFETLTKLVDYEPGLARGDFLPSIELYVDRIVERGAGGLCWTLARGLHFLLTDLGFDSALMYMDPGHCCVRVNLQEGSYYADTGYSAPLFRAYPLFESFALETPSERFEYNVRGDGIFVARKPGPAKKLDPAPRSLESLKPLIDAANDWNSPRTFLAMLAISKHVDGVYTSLQNGTLRRYLPAGVETTAVNSGEAPETAARIFGIDPELYLEAAAIQARYLGTASKLTFG